jgi:hypothetical protein
MWKGHMQMFKISANSQHNTHEQTSFQMIPCKLGTFQRRPTHGGAEAHAWRSRGKALLLYPI